MLAKVSCSVGIVATLVALGCGGTRQLPREAKAAPPRASSKPSCARAHAARVPLPVDAGSGSAIALVRAGGASKSRTLAYVADVDTATLYTVDIDREGELARTPLEGVPSQLLVHSDGRVVVALRDSSALQVLEPSEDASRALDTRCVVDTPTEPVGLALVPDRKLLLVTSGWGHALSAYDAESLATRMSVDLPREPRAVAVSDDGARAFVSHAVGGRVSVVKIDGQRAVVRSLSVNPPLERGKGGVTGKPGARSAENRFAIQGFALAKSSSLGGRILAPQVQVDRGDPSTPTSRGYSDSLEPQMPEIAVLDDNVSDAPESSSDDAPDTGPTFARRDPRTDECLLPRAAVIDPETESLFVACLGIDSVVEYDAALADRRRAEHRRFSVPAGPIGLALDPAHRRLVVWSQFDRVLTLLPLATDSTGLFPSAEQEKLISLSKPSAVVEGADIALGRRLFHAVGNPRISLDGRSCASCHVDGRDDGLTWATPDGPRQTPMLVGRIEDTAPYGWGGSVEELSDHMRQTFERLSGSGLTDHEANALLAYVSSLRAPVSPHATETARVARGKAIFESPEVGCASCHGGETFTDGETHDVGSKAAGDRTAEFDTPSLLSIGGTAPYFHDGRFSSLEDLLAATDGRMGATSQLSKQDRQALIAYLESL